MAHARRKFHEARNQGGTICLFIIRQMQNLYHIEETLRTARSSPRIRVAVRAECSRPIMARLHRLCAKLQETRRFLPRSEMGQAIAYLLNQWQHLGQCLEDGRMEIDNNLVEPERSGDGLPKAARRASAARQNAIRPTAIGKTNWLFVGTETAGETTAILYTVIEYARRRGIDPQKRLRRILNGLPRMKILEVPRLLASESHPNRIRIASESHPNRIRIAFSRPARGKGLSTCHACVTPRGKGLSTCHVSRPRKRSVHLSRGLAAR